MIQSGLRPDFERIRKARSETRSPERIIAHYELEARLSRTLMASDQNDRLSLYSELYEQLFTELPDHPQRSGREKIRAEQIEVQRAMLLRMLNQSSTYVEIGCGDAVLTKAIAPNVASAIGVDVTEKLVEGDRPASFRFVLSNGINIPLPEATADLVYSNHLMEHLHPDDAVAQL